MTETHYPVRVIGMRLISSVPRADGRQIVARFDAQVGPLILTGCVVMISQNGSVIPLLPEAKVRDEAKPIKFRSASYKASFFEEVRKVYATMIEPASVVDDTDYSDDAREDRRTSLQ